jgi:trimethylamine--corrinoid protein Co-methyltransferase
MSVKGFRCKQPIEYLTKNEIKKIHHASLEILEEVGMRVMHKRSRDLLEEAGCKVDHEAELVRFPPDLVQWAIGQCPATFPWKSRNQENDLIVGGDSIYIGNNRGLWYLDPETEERREGSTEDLAYAVKLLDALPDIHFVFRPFSFLSDHPAEVEMLWVYATMLRHSDKPLMSVAFGDLSDRLIPMFEAAGGQSYVSVSPRSPLCLPDDQCHELLNHAFANHPISIYGGGSKNADSPATMAACLVLANATGLGGVVLAQVANPGISVSFDIAPVDLLDVRYGTSSSGSVELGVMAVASVQIARYHGIPAGTWVNTDSPLPDPQAAYEKQFLTLLSAQAGANIIQPIGQLESQNTFSPVQTVIDHEICGMVGKVLEGIRVDEETLALDLIKQVGPVPGNFLGTEHTRQHWRDETFLPTIGVRENYEAWVRSGSKGSVERARDKALELMKTHEPNPLPPEVEKEIARILAAAEREKLQ